MVSIRGVLTSSYSRSRSRSRTAQCQYYHSISHSEAFYLLLMLAWRVFHCRWLIASARLYTRVQRIQRGFSWERRWGRITLYRNNFGTRHRTMLYDLGRICGNAGSISRVMRFGQVRVEREIRRSRFKKGRRSRIRRKRWPMPWLFESTVLLSIKIILIICKTR
jgi:hypothetical protein